MYIMGIVVTGCSSKCSVVVIIVSLVCNGLLLVIWHVNSRGQCLRPSHGVHCSAQLLSLVPTQLNGDAFLRFNLHFYMLAFVSLPLSLHACTSTCAYNYIMWPCMYTCVLLGSYLASGQTIYRPFTGYGKGVGHYKVGQ